MIPGSATALKAIGLMSGTSMDGVDAAFITTDGHEVQQRGPSLTQPYPADLRSALLAVARDEFAASGPLEELEDRVTDANADAVRRLLRMAGVDRRDVELVGMHGQTILHRPARRFTRQLGKGDRLAADLGIDVVDSFRIADVASGGQGAPLAPLYHAALAIGLPQPLAVLNLGGVANVTYIGGDTILAFDTGPASALIDDWIAERTSLAYDEDGRHAARGRVQEQPLATMLRAPYFDRRPPKSLDRNDFSRAAVAGLSVEDGAATLTAFTARATALARAHFPDAPLRWLVTGGGRHNETLMRMLREALVVPVDPVESVGWDGDSLEAEAFGFLAVRSARGLPLSLPGTTGVAMPTPGGTLHRAPR